MVNYIVNFTDVNATPITIGEGDINTTSTDISLFGRIRLEYGELLNENLLHLLENFSCPEDPSNPGTPSLNISHGELFSASTQGQFWHNSTTGILHYWSGAWWIPLRGVEDVAANWGGVWNGEYLPKPVSPTTGYIFDYSECIWSVAPAGYDGSFSGMVCATNSSGRVQMEYRLTGASTVQDGLANYLIIGIRGNSNLGSLIAPPPIIGVTPSSTPILQTQIPLLSQTPTVSTPASTPPVPTPSPTSVIDPLGTNARLYMSPATCDPGTPGPGGTLKKHYWTCGQVSKSAYDQSIYVSIQGISGGVGPYRMDFTNISHVTTLYGSDFSGAVEFDPLPVCAFEYGSFYPNSGIIKTYFGGFGSTTDPVRTGVSSGEIVYVRIKFDAASFCYSHNYNISFSLSGKVIVTDSVGTVKQWWIPKTSGPDEKYIDGCPAGGTNITTLPASTLLWGFAWGHKGIGGCVDCSGCIP